MQTTFPRLDDPAHEENSYRPSLWCWLSYFWHLSSIFFLLCFFSLSSWFYQFVHFLLFFCFIPFSPAQAHTGQEASTTASPGPVPGFPASHEEPFYTEHELKSPSKLGSTPALQRATSCASGTEIWVGSQSCPGVGRVARRRGSYEAGKGGRRGNEPTEMQPFWFWHGDRCLASSRSLDWRLEAQRAVPSNQHFCDPTRRHQTQLFHVSAQAAGKHRWSGSLLPGVTRSVIAARNGCPVRQLF